MDVLRDLLKIHKMTSSNYCESLQTLSKILTNIHNSPYIEKIRMLKKSNPTLKRLIFENEAPSLILIMCGFEETLIEDQNVLILKPENDRFTLTRILV